MTAISIPRIIANRILAHVQRHTEHEVCGLIASKAGIPHRCYEVVNIAADAATRFQMDPAGQIGAMRAMREAGEELFAIYHSHPHSPPRPSAIDLAQAAYPDALYLIVSLDTTGVLEMRGFQMHGGEAREVALELA